MRAPTIPEAHLGAVILATVLTWSWIGYFAWHNPGVGPLVTPLVFIPFGVWLRWAWRSVQSQRRSGGYLADDDPRRTMAASAQVQGEQAARAFAQAVARGELRHLDERQQ